MVMFDADSEAAQCKTGFMCRQYANADKGGMIFGSTHERQEVCPVGNKCPQPPTATLPIACDPENGEYQD